MEHLILIRVNDGRIRGISQLLLGLGTMADTFLSQSDRSGAGVGKECCSSQSEAEREGDASVLRQPGQRTEDTGSLHYTESHGETWTIISPVI